MSSDIAGSGALNQSEASGRSGGPAGSTGPPSAMHMLVELAVATAIAGYFYMRAKKQTARIDLLSRRLDESAARIDHLEEGLMAVVQFLPNGGARASVMRVLQAPPRPRAPRVQYSSPADPVAPPLPPPPRPQQQRQYRRPAPNPLESMMSMIAPMVSSFVVGSMDEQASESSGSPDRGGDDDGDGAASPGPPVVVVDEGEGEVTEDEIEAELQELSPETPPETPPEPSPASPSVPTV